MQIYLDATDAQMEDHRQPMRAWGREVAFISDCCRTKEPAQDRLQQALSRLVLLPAISTLAFLRLGVRRGVGPVPNRREAVQAFDPLLQCISILAQYRNRLHVSTLIASSHKIVDILLELLR